MKATLFVTQPFTEGKWQTVSCKELPDFSHPILQPVIAKVDEQLYMVFDAKTGMPLTARFAKADQADRLDRMVYEANIYIKTDEDLSKLVADFAKAYPNYNNVITNTTQNDPTKI